ncbi:hypothetical protein O7623_12885 [Solwaraspora sp. WMMD791]|uniref:hypothetical protein n=1 Tax=Solwaraspora sp. WMMD791 TaxID=3016086 RepID=UPI002499BF63|nr:hypothetical protein [Solwaraspora sp. WMMD791]WFE30023.1 hypothetical protein O7623_12885 [Solwaraspora sp. WMMD791]
MLVDIDIDSDYWDLPVLREAIAARVWGAATEDDPYGQAPSYPMAAVTPSYPMAVGSSYPTVVVPAARSGGGRHRRATPVG